jgi:hypothetical protein
MKQVHFGGIITDNKKRLGFKMYFDTIEEAQYYKDLFMFQLHGEGYIIGETKCYYDKKVKE